MQMLLTMFYAEELKRRVLDLIQTTDELWNRLKPGERPERVPKGVKNPVDKALNALIQDGAITAAEKVEIVALIDYRNLIGHRMHELVADLSTEQYARDLADFGSDRVREFDYEVVDRLQHFRKRLGELYRTHHYVSTISMNGLLFESAERTFLAEIKALKHKLGKLARARQKDIAAINAELKLAGTEFDNNDCFPGHPLHRYDNKRLTQRGAEICYRLFDSGRSPMAAAHLMDISVYAARKRHKTWAALGGARREKVDLEALPRRKFYRKHDD
ncbi:hypothetical protein ASD80_08230 [Devosia sp. Root635]|nr:hypothetical protein ASD80_08230 [Devosia sp. Root635]